MPLQVHTLLTHEYPDLDGLVGCWLLQRFGAELFPGVATAELRFLPAAFSLDGKTAAEQELQGGLAVDIGGGRFDNHLAGVLAGNESGLKESATSLIATALEVRDRPGLQCLVEFVRLQDIQGRSLTSKNPEDHALAMVSVLRGFHLVNREGFHKTYLQLMPLLDAIAGVTESAADVLHWYRTMRPFPFSLEGVKHLAANPFDAAAALWLHHDRSSRPGGARGAVPAIGARDLQASGSATRILARAWGSEGEAELEKLLSFAGLVRVLGQGGYLEDLDFSVTALNVLYGLHKIHDAIEPAAAALFPYLDAMMALERDWVRALEDFPSCSRIVNAGQGKLRVRICAFESASPSMARVARYKRHPDVSIHRDTEIGSTGITLMQHQGPLKDFTFDGRGGHPTDNQPTGRPRTDSMVARVRVAEALAAGERIDVERINDVGMVNGWFLHQSLRILAKGSRKARDVPPSRIPLDKLVALIASTFEPHKPLPEPWGHAGRCTPETCAFSRLRLPNCLAGQ